MQQEEGLLRLNGCLVVMDVPRGFFYSGSNRNIRVCRAAKSRGGPFFMRRNVYNFFIVDTGEGKGGAESEKVTHIYRALLVRICICSLIHDNGDCFRHDLSENHAGDCG